MLAIKSCSISLAALLLLLAIDCATALPSIRRDLIEPDLGGHNCFEEKRDLVYPDLGAHNCEARGGRGYRDGCCGY